MKPCPSLFVFSFVLFLISCQNGANNKDYEPLSDTASITGLTGDSVKLVKTAAINFKVKDVEHSTRDVSGLAQRFGGMVFSQNLESVEEGRKELKISADSLMVITAIAPRADVTVRIPSEHLEEFMFYAADLGYYTGSSRLQIDDKSLVYLENALKQKNRTEVLSKPSTKNSKPPTSLQTIAVKDEAVEQQIANRMIDADVKYSTVNLNLFQNATIKKEIVANYNLTDYDLPFSQRFGNAMSTGWHYFLSVVVALAHLWMFFLLAIAFILFYRYWPKRKLSASN